MKTVIQTILFVLLACIVQGAAATESVTFSSLLEEMTDRATVCKRSDPPFVLKQQSSYDRASISPDAQGWFANKDWSNYIREELNNGRRELVLFEATGPGAIVRIWNFCTPWVGNVRFYIDGDTKPVIAGPIEEIIGGTLLVGSPLSEICAMGHNFYLPIPYAKSCKITIDAAPEGMVEGNDRLVYYNVNYRTYPAETPVESFHHNTIAEHAGKIETAGRALLENNNESRRGVSKFSSLGGKISPGKRNSITVSFDPEGLRAIHRLSMKLEAKDRDQALRSTILSITFDGKRTVFCPVGDFFGTGVGINPHQSRYTNVSEDGTLTSYWSMPLTKEAKIELINFGDQEVDLKFIEGCDSACDDSGEPLYFHASWHQTRNATTRPVTDWNAITLEGRGIYVGDVLSLVNYHPFWWGEGDEKITVDGEAFPSHFGTGTEDYYGYAWSSTELFSHPFVGQPRSEGPDHPTLPGRDLQCFGNNTNWRYRALDTIPFEKSFNFDIEIFHHANAKVDYSMATFWYGDRDCKIVDGPTDEQIIEEAQQPVYYHTPSQLRSPEVAAREEQTARWREQLRLIDLHQHVNFHEPHLKRDIDIMDQVGVGIVVNLSGGTVTKNAGEKSEFERNKELADSVHPGRFLHFFSLDFNGWNEENWSENAVAQVDEAFRLGAAGLKEYKRLGLFYRDSNGELIKIDDPKLDPVWKRCGELNMPVTIHVADPQAFWKPYDETNERWEELRDHPGWWFGDPEKYPAFYELLDALNRVILRHPETIFIAAHCGNNAEDLDWVADALDKAPNLMIDIAARVPEIGRHPVDKVNEFFTKYADRILFGTDFMVYDRLILGSSGNEPPPTDEVAIEFFNKHWRFFDTNDRYFAHMTPIQGNWTISAVGLPIESQRKILFDNARRILAPFLPPPTLYVIPIESDGKEGEISETIKLDGKIDESIWNRANPIHVELTLVQAQSYPDLSTTVRAVYDDEAIYFAFEAPFTELTIFDPVSEQERLGLWDRDVVEVFLATDNPETLYYEFEVAPTGEKLDVAVRLPEKDFDWGGQFEAATFIDDEKKIWGTEIRIPWNILTDEASNPVAPPQSGTGWQANFYRNDRANVVFLNWNPTLKSTAHAPERFGKMIFK